MMDEYDNSLTPFVKTIAAGAEAVIAAFPAEKPVLALSDGSILFADSGERVQAFPDATILLARADGKRIVAGGDDGRVVEIGADGQISTLGDEQGKWIDAVAIRDDGATAWSAGKQVRARDNKGAVRSWVAPSSVRGLAFMPKGYRVAAIATGHGDR
jgi:hypothetical protein